MIDAQTVQQTAQAAQAAGSSVVLPAGLAAGGVLVLERILEAGIKALAAARRNNGAKASAGNVSVNVGGAIAGGGNGNGKGGGEKAMTADERKMLSDHHRDLGRHEEQIRALCTTFDRYHEENREDHRGILHAIEDLKRGRA